MEILWLRYLTEIDEKTLEVPEELLENPEIKKAVTVLEESAFTPEQLLGYEKFWDIISVEKTLISSAERKGRKEGIEEGIEKGKIEANRENARKMKLSGISAEMIHQITELPLSEIEKL